MLIESNSFLVSEEWVRRNDVEKVAFSWVQQVMLGFEIMKKSNVI